MIISTPGERVLKDVIQRLREALKDGVQDAGELFEEDGAGWHQLSLTWTEQESIMEPPHDA